MSYLFRYRRAFGLNSNDIPLKILYLLYLFCFYALKAEVVCEGLKSCYIYIYIYIYIYASIFVDLGYGWHFMLSLYSNFGLKKNCSL